MPLKTISNNGSMVSRAFTPKINGFSGFNKAIKPAGFATKSSRLLESKSKAIVKPRRSRSPLGPRSAAHRFSFNTPSSTKVIMKPGYTDTRNRSSKKKSFIISDSRFPQAPVRALHIAERKNFHTKVTASQNALNIPTNSTFTPFNNENKVLYVTPTPERNERHFASLPVLTLDSVAQTWSAVNLRPTDFDFAANGVFVAPCGEHVICDKEMCLCVDRCYCEYPQWIETYLHCNGSFTQRMFHGDMEDEQAISRDGKHNLILKPCGYAGCDVCEGTDIESTEDFLGY